MLRLLSSLFIVASCCSAAVTSPSSTCLHHQTDKKCYEACGNDSSFTVAGLDTKGACPLEYTQIDSTKHVKQCSDGATNIKYCTGQGLHIVDLVESVKGMKGTCVHAIQGNKCFEGCADATFVMSGLNVTGGCPSVFSVTDKTEEVLSCSDGKTNAKYCTAPLYLVNVTMRTKGESSPATEALTAAHTGGFQTWMAGKGESSMLVHQIVTSPGDHCLEIAVPGGQASPFWKAEGWKYSAPVRPEWKEGGCDRTKWTSIDATTADYDGYSAVKNAPFSAVKLIKYGIKTDLLMAQVLGVAPTKKCLHHIDLEDHKCFEACAESAFSTRGISDMGSCPAKYDTVDKRAIVEQCPDGVTSIRYCNSINVTIVTKGEALVMPIH